MNNLVRALKSTVAKRARELGIEQPRVDWKLGPNGDVLVAIIMRRR